MTADSSGPRALSWVKRKHFLVCAALLLGGVFLHQAVLGVFVPMLALVNALWGLVLIGFVTAAGARAYRRMRDAEELARQERGAVLEQLEESERRRSRAEREQEEAVRLAQLGRRAVSLVREVSNPLAYVTVNLEFVEQELRREEGLEDRAELCEVLADMRRGTLRIQEAVSDLRRSVRELEGEKDAVGRPDDAMQVVRQLASMRLKSPGEAVLDVSPGLPPVRLRHPHLVEILMNLLEHAAGAVEAAVPARAARIVVRARRVEGGVRMEVEDNGPGIPPDMLPRLFEPLFKTRLTGLALYRDYATRAGGSLHAENLPEGGTRFVLVLPEATAPAAVA